MNGTIEEEILSLYNEQRWEDIVNMNCTHEEVEKCRLFWVLPSMPDLIWIREQIRKHNGIGLVSIGCGCGLLEWLFQKLSGLDVIGIELDQSWWCSKYSPPLFLENIIFIRENETKNFCISDRYAILFCYFNNEQAFYSYAKNYRGNLILVIGPSDNQLRFTDPLPFDRKFEELGWRLAAKSQIGRCNDCIVAYTR